jgi:preprotein translocase subunit SecG
LVIFVLTCIFLVVVVLLQDEQGEGLGGIFGGGSATPFGSRSGNILTKFTSILGAIFIVCAFGLAWINKTSEEGDVIGAARRSGNAAQENSDWWNAPDQEESEQETVDSE